jgi:hypothetical protein
MNHMVMSMSKDVSVTRINFNCNKSTSITTTYCILKNKTEVGT